MKKSIISLLAIIVIAASCKKDKSSITPTPVTPKRAIVSTLAGKGITGFIEGDALNAAFFAPQDVAVGADGSVYVTDLFNSRIRKINNGRVSTLAGDGISHFLNGTGATAGFLFPTKITIDANGNLYALDGRDPRVRKISTVAEVSTFAGMETNGLRNGRVTDAQFQEGADGIVVDAQGNIYLADTFNNCIRLITPAGDVTTFAGTGVVGATNGDAAHATFNLPGGITIDKDGNLYVLEQGNNLIRKIVPGGQVTTFAGSGNHGSRDGDARNAEFNLLRDIVIDTHGDLYVTDDSKVRKISKDGIVSTIAGSVTAGHQDGEGTDAKFFFPAGMAIDAQDNIYIADLFDNRIRKIIFQ